MSAIEVSPADDLLVHQLPDPVAVVGGEERGWFDRFYFALLPPGGGLATFGAGVYPNAGVIDGYACAVRDGRQRNLRCSDALGPDRLRGEVGPLSWEPFEPLRSWRLALGQNPGGCRLDATWTASGPPWAERVTVAAGGADFGHFLQFGQWHGTLSVGAETLELDGALGVRDRSWGVRGARQRLGMHIWVLAACGDTTLAVHYNEHRDGSPQHCSGALLRAGGEPVEVVSVAHDLDLDGEGELRGGRLLVATAAGERLELVCEGAHPGLYMAGAGYGGWHGVDRGREHVEHEAWTLDGDPNPRTLPLGLTDKACDFWLDGREGGGVFELALSRSAGYSYRPGGGSVG